MDLTQLLRPIIELTARHHAKNQWQEFTEKVDEIIKSHDIIAQIDLSTIPCEIGTYSRTAIMYHETQPWEMVITRWNAGDFSVIHGHPAYALYYPLIGQYDMDLYDCLDAETQQISLRQHLVLNPGQYVHHIGTEGRYDNYIHQVFANQPSLTLHIYSELASRGLRYGVSR